MYLKEVNEQFENWIKSNETVLKQKIPEYVKGVTESIKGLYKFYSVLPDDVIGAAGIGLVGRILLGKYGLLAGALYFIYQKIKDLNKFMVSLEKRKPPGLSGWRELWKATREKRNALVPVPWKAKEYVVPPPPKKVPVRAPVRVPVPPPASAPVPKGYKEAKKKKEKLLTDANAFYMGLTLSETEFERQELEKRLKNWTDIGFSKKKASEILYLETNRMAMEATKEQRDFYAAFQKDYEEMNMTTTEKERKELQTRVDQAIEIGFDQIKAKEYLENELTRIEYEANAERRRTLEGFREEDRRLGMTDYELELARLQDRVTARAEAGMSIMELANYEATELRRINKETADKQVETDRQAMMTRLEFARSMTGGIADTFRMISQAGGKQSAAAFGVYKAFAIIEATIAAHKAFVMALANPPGPPFSYVMAGLALAQGLIQVALIASARPPSYAEGGISMRPEYAMVGEKGPEAHIPLKGGAIPVVTTSPQQVTIVNVTDLSMLDAYFASSRGQDAVLNVISNRGLSVRRVLR